MTRRLSFVALLATAIAMTACADATAPKGDCIKGGTVGSGTCMTTTAR